MEKIPRTREVVREGGEGRQRRVVAIEEEGKEVERESFSHHLEEVPQAREVSRERERGGKRRKNMEEERRTD